MSLLRWLNPFALPWLLLKTGLKVALLLGAVVLFFGLWAFWWEPDSLRVSPYSLQPPGWPAALDGFKVAVISDLHAGSPFINEAKIRRVVAMTNAQHPDLILLPGDFMIQRVVGGHYMPSEKLAPLLAPLRARYGVFAVLGNHDRWDHPDQIQSALQTHGIPVLEDHSRRLMIQGRPLWLVGISDEWTGPKNIAQAFAGVPKSGATQSGAPVLCFSHSPDVFRRFPPRVCGLSIAGHTHGGQVNFPLLGRLIVPVRFYRGARSAGVVHDGAELRFISTGIGSSSFPVRFGVPPEISLLILRSASSHAH